MNRPPIHPLSAVALVVIDSLWTLVDFAALAWGVTIPLSFICCFIPVFLLQKFLNGDPNGKAGAYAFLLALLAAVPFPITGTAAGMAVLAWAGLSFMSKGIEQQKP